jgi:hypothetical protein
LLNIAAFAAVPVLAGVSAAAPLLKTCFITVGGGKGQMC